MSILERSSTVGCTLQCVREVRLPIEYERREDVRAFYADVLGLGEWPPAAQVPGGFGVGGRICGLHLQFRHTPLPREMGRRLVLLTDSLDELARRFEEQGRAFERLRGFGCSDDCIFVNDPAGYLIEIRQRRPL